MKNLITKAHITLNIGVIELCERVCKPYDEIRSGLNKLCKMGLIKAINRVNDKAIELIKK
jgi:hypothetical protein